MSDEKKLKYKNGNIVLLNDSRNVYIMDCYPKEKKYLVYDCDREKSETFIVNEHEIFMLIVSA